MPDGISRKNGQVSHALDAESIHAVGAVSGECCRGWLDMQSCGGWYLLIIKVICDGLER